MNVEYFQVHTSVDSEEAAEALVTNVVQSRMAAAAQVCGPISSTYWTDGEVGSMEEWTIIFETTAERLPALQQYILSCSTYEAEMTQVLCTPVTAGNPGYLARIARDTHSGGPVPAGVPQQPAYAQQPGVPQPAGFPPPPPPAAYPQPGMAPAPGFPPPPPQQPWGQQG